MSLIDFIFKQSFKVEVLHTLPGRLRVHVPLLKKISEDFEPTAETIEELLFTVPGIQNVTPNYISGNMLIKYDAKTINTGAIINCLNVIWKTLVTNRRYIINADKKKLESITKKLTNYLKKANINLVNIIGEIRIPNEIWI